MNSVEFRFTGQPYGFIPVDEQQVDLPEGAVSVAHRPAAGWIFRLVDKVEHGGDDGHGPIGFRLPEQGGQMVVQLWNQRCGAQPDDIRLEEGFRQQIRGVAVTCADGIDEGAFPFAVMSARIGQHIGAGRRSVQLNIMLRIDGRLFNDGTDELSAFIIAGCPVEIEMNRLIGKDLSGIDRSDNGGPAKISYIRSTSSGDGPEQGCVIFSFEFLR